MIPNVTAEDLRNRIDALELSPRLRGLREKYFEEAPQVCSERLKYAMQAWKETEGEPIEIRSAKKLRRILDGMTITIHEGEMTAGNQCRFFRGCAPYVDGNAPYFEKVIEAGDKVTFGSPALVGTMSDEDWQICKEAAAYYKGRTAAEAARSVARAMWGDWYDDAMDVRTLPNPYEDQLYQQGIPMWDKLLEVGLGGAIRETEAALERFRASNEYDPEKIYFWQAVKDSCQAVIAFAHRHAAHARELAKKESNPARRQELEEMAEACEWAPENPARSFLEAVQSLRLLDAALLIENGRKAPDPGRLDQFLYPYFKRDVEEGRLTLEKAADILGDFITYLARHEQIKTFRGRETHQATMITHITLGGTIKGGQDGSNELTYLILQVLSLLRYAEPHCALRLHDGTPSWILVKALETNQKVNGIPMYVNDTHITNYVHQRGIPLDEARDWAIFGCSQPLSPQRGHHKPMAINTAVPLDLALHNGVSPLTGRRIGVETGDPRNFKTFEEVYEAYRKQYEFVIRRLLRVQRLMHFAEVQCYRMPLRSALDKASIQNGKSHMLGGADSYPLWHIKDRCLVDVADSLTAIKKLVFDEKKVTMGELLEALDSDFAGDTAEEIRRMCLAAPKYGNDIEEADDMVRDIGKFSASVILSEKNPFGWPYCINRNGVSVHYAAGKGVGATPNGRKSRAPFADGSLSPMNGMDKHGPTAVLNSALKADFTDALVAILNQKFPLTLVNNPESMEKIGALTTTFIRNGGLHIQYNFVDRNVLLDAKKHPERYKDLVVRVAGYSAYFVNLTSEVQDEIISRTEQSL